MSAELDRNPSPPPGILSDEEFLPDRIADTVYSKRWTIKTLMNIVQASYKPDTDEKDSTENIDVDNDIVELDSAVEEDACTLWDMSASKAVAEYLVEFGVLEIFLDIIHRTKSPRLLEIIIGILGNICTFDELCQKLSENNDFINTVLILSGTTDTPSLIQLFRLIRCGIKNANCQASWYESFERNPFFMENVKDILSNTLNCNVIQVAFQFLCTLLIENTNYCDIWGQEFFLTSVIVAGQQLFVKKECLDNFFNLLNSLCAYPSVAKAVVQKWCELKHLFKGYIDNLGKEDSLFDSARLSSVYSYFNAYITLLNDPCMKTDMVADLNMLVPFARILALVNRLIANMIKNNLRALENTESDKRNGSLQRIEQRNGTQYITMMSRDEFDMWEILSNIIIDAAKTHQKVANQEGGEIILEKIVNAGTSSDDTGSTIL